MVTEEIGNFLREEDFWSEEEEDRDINQKTEALTPLQQLQILKQRIKLLNSIPVVTPLDLHAAHQTSPSVEENNFLLLKALRQNLTQFYEV